jgi:uncharacterized membrane protein
LARIWEYEILPPSLNADEASIGIDAFNLLHYGIDRNGIPFPVQFISWGSGQNALYGYVLIPFIALYGLSRIIVRIPMLISGILTIPLVYFIAKQTLGEAFGLLSMFFIAICPWHILLSRWGLESNFFPFVFLLGYACLLMASKSYSWFILGCIFFAQALYAYGTAYAIIPIFMICACWILYKEKQIPLRITLAGILVFTIFALPISLFIVINSFRLNGLHFGLMTIPRLPTIPRYESQSAFFGNQILLTLSTNISILFKLLITQSDGIAYNVVEPFGYFYTITFPLAVIGAGVLIHYSYKSYQTKLLLAWLAAALISGVLEPVNINRINIIFIPLILCIAACVLWITNTSKVYLGIATGIFFIGFICFMAVYNSPNYREKANRKFYTGILPALDFARQFGSNPICVTDKFNMPYIFALFSEKENPADYLASVKYVDPQAPLRQVLSFGRYTFGIKNCKQNPLTIFIVLADAKQPRLGENYRTRDFSNFTLYYPIP